jgi:predicted nucleotidyltransferase
VPIDAVALEALRRLVHTLGADRLVIIGATVPIVLIDLRQGVSGARTTRDIDALVRAASWAEFEALKQRLIAVGFRQGGGAPHRLRYGTAEIDLIPYSKALAPGDRLEWPGEDRAMTALGLEEAFESARPEPIADLLVPMVPVAASILLKFIAYHDRPYERARDLTDIIHCFEHYAELPDARRFEIGDVEVDRTAVAYEEAGAYLLGQEVASLARPESRSIIERLSATVQDEYARPIQQILVEEHRFSAADDRRRGLYRLFRVFSAGLGHPR